MRVRTISSLQDLEKKEGEHKKSENIAHTEYNTLCKQFGITGYSTIRRELTEKVKELPNIYERIAEKTKSLDKIVEFYCAFMEFTLLQQCDNTVPVIKHVIGTYEIGIRVERRYTDVKCHLCRERKYDDIRVHLRRGPSIDNRTTVGHQGR